MEISDLSGIAVIIDDEINQSDSNIFKLAETISRNNIPCLKYDRIPNENFIDNFSNAPFVIVDWQLNHTDLPEGVALPQETLQSAQEEVISFIKALRNKCFCPIFIFTNTDLSEVNKALRKAKLIDQQSTDMLLVRSKSQLQDEKLFEEIFSWIEENPTVHTLLRWESKYEDAKNRLFTDFYNLSHSWPKVLWDTYIEDGVNPTEELGLMITRNLLCRMRPFEFEDAVFQKKHKPNKTEIRKVLGGEKFIEDLPDGNIRSGDVFSIDGTYYINIRPDCDCIPRADEDPDIYLLKMSKLSSGNEKKAYDSKYGNFNERTNEAIIFNMYESKSFKIQFKNVVLKSRSEVINSRVGRLIPPHSTRVLQRYSLYLQREGLPRVPKHAILSDDEIAKLDI